MYDRMLALHFNFSHSKDLIGCLLFLVAQAMTIIYSKALIGWRLSLAAPQNRCSLTSCCGAVGCNRSHFISHLHLIQQPICSKQLNLFVVRILTLTIYQLSYVDQSMYGLDFAAEVISSLTLCWQTILNSNSHNAKS